MDTYAQIYDRALNLTGGEKALREHLPKPRSARALKARGGDYYLSEMSRAVFCSGFVWRIVDYKWPEMSQVLHDFDPVACAFQPDEAIEALTGDKRVIRHYKKLLSVRDNAQFVLEIEQEAGSFGAWLAAWPIEDIVGLHAALKKRGSRLGGRTGQFFLRRAGKDSFVLARDVVGAMMRMGVIDKFPTAKRDLAKVQAAFNDWHAQSGRPLCEISRVLSMSIEA
jgi:3-methyladenine DNA glycosylase Tag